MKKSSNCLIGKFLSIYFNTTMSLFACNKVVSVMGLFYKNYFFLNSSQHFILVWHDWLDFFFDCSIFLVSPSFRSSLPFISVMQLDIKSVFLCFSYLRNVQSSSALQEHQVACLLNKPECFFVLFCFFESTDVKLYMLWMQTVS